MKYNNYHAEVGFWFISWKTIKLQYKVTDYQFLNP